MQAIVEHIQYADLNGRQPCRASKRKQILMKPSPRGIRQDRNRSGSPIPQCTEPAKKVCSSKPLVTFLYRKVEQKGVGLSLLNIDHASRERLLCYNLF